MIIQAFNPDISQYEQTSLSVPSAAAATSLTVKNSDRFAATNRALVGMMGRERSEIVSVSAVPNATSLTVGALSLPHSTDDPVINMRFDQVRFYRSTTGVGGTYSVLATVAMDVDNPDNSTYYDDAAGLTTYYYKNSFYNSVTTVETLLSDPIPGSGLGPTTAGAIIDQVASEVGDKEFLGASRDDYFAWLNEVNYALQKRMRKPYDFLKTKQLADPIAGDGIPYPTDVLHFDTVSYTYTVGTTTRTYSPVRVFEDEWIRLNESPATVVASDEIRYVYYDDVDEKIYTYPEFATSQTDSFVIRYWKKFTYITGDASEIETIDPQVYKTYLKGNYYRKKGAREKSYLPLSDRWFSDYNVELAQVVKYNRKNLGEPQSFRPERRPSLLYGARRS